VINAIDPGGIPNVVQRITVQDQEIGSLPGLQRPAIHGPNNFGTVFGGADNGIHRAQTSLNEQLQFTMLGKALARLCF
jgi:hypothetical protein